MLGRDAASRGVRLEWLSGARRVAGRVSGGCPRRADVLASAREPALTPPTPVSNKHVILGCAGPGQYYLVRTPRARARRAVEGRARAARQAGSRRGAATRGAPPPPGRLTPAASSPLRRWTTRPTARG